MNDNMGIDPFRYLKKSIILVIFYESLKYNKCAIVLFFQITKPLVSELNIHQNT